MGICITRVFFVWSLYCLSIFDLLLMITSLVSYDYLLWLPVWYLMITSYDYLFGILWLPLWYLMITSYDYLFGILWLPLWYLMITSLVSYDYLFGILWLPLWYLMITSLVSYDYLFGILWLPLWYHQTFLTWYLIMLCLFLSFLFCLSFFHLRFLIPPFGILKHFF